MVLHKILSHICTSVRKTLLFDSFKSILLYIQILVFVCFYLFLFIKLIEWSETFSSRMLLQLIKFQFIVLPSQVCAIVNLLLGCLIITFHLPCFMSERKFLFYSRSSTLSSVSKTYKVIFSKI